MHLIQRRINELISKKPFLLAVFVAAGVFLLYAGTLIPEVGWGDSAELSLVAYQLGLSHPPGSPLHALLGKLLTMFFTEPALGTNLLSAIGTSLAAGAMSLILYELSAGTMISIGIPVLFSVLPNIWEMAVVTEVYNVNIFFLGASIYLFLKAEQTQFSRYLLPSAVLFGLSLGTYQANLLLLPVFLLMLFLRSPRDKKLEQLVKFCSIVGIIWLSFAGYSIVRSRSDLAIAYQLNSFQEIVSYLSGAGLRPSFPTDAAYYVGRTLEHARVFSRNFLYMPIPFGLLGVYGLYKRKHSSALFLTLLFVINYLFFSYYAVSDYATMPTPAYYFFSIFFGYGLAFHAHLWPGRNRILGYAGVALCVILVGSQLVLQFPARFERSNTVPVTELIVPALEAFPQDAIVLSRWERYAPMLYYQQTRNMRKDVTLVVSDDFPAQIESYFASTQDRQILIDNHADILTDKYRIERYYRRWFLISGPVNE